MTVYEVNTNDGEPTLAFATKREALAFARKNRKHAVDIDAITIVPMTKRAVVALINIEGGYVVDRKRIATFPAKQNEGDVK